MTKQQRSNLAKTAIFLIEEAKDEHFSMFTYLYADGNVNDNPEDAKRSYNECGTTCCFAGHGPIALRAKIHDLEEWDSYILRVFGTDESDFIIGTDWSFLFSPMWNNSRKQAASRALTLLEKGTPEKYSEFDSTYFTSFSNRKLVDRLRAFVISKKKL